MNTGHIFAKIAVLISCSMAFAVNGTQYYNLAGKITSSGTGPAATQSKSVYLYQAAMACTVGQTYGEGTCLASVKDTPANLADMLKKNWVDKKDYKTADFFLRSDIDLGELSTTGECVVNHVPLPTPKGVKMYFSSSTNRYTFKNLCYSSSDPMTGPVGLFESVDGANMAEPALKGVKITVSGSSNGADYYPVGALVGQTNLTTIQNVLLQDVEIDAPMAGAVVGMLKSSTVKITAYNDDIFVNNSVAIETGYAGSQSFEEMSDHKVFLGGVAGVAIRAENDHASFDSVYVTVKVKNLAKGQKSALGGVAGLYSTIGETITRVNVINKINYGQQAYGQQTTTTTGWGTTTTWPYTGYPTYTTVATDTIESVISGGSAMGGLFGVMTVFRQNNTPVLGNFSMKNSHFEGTITGASVSAGGKMAVGGLIGSDSLMAGMSVTIDGSSANPVIVDSVRASGKYSYHAGGLVGYGSAGACSNGSSATASSEYLSITNSKTLGSIDLSGEASAAGESFHMQTFVGGIVGAACLSHDGNGLKTDSSSMKISVKSRNTVDAASSLYDSLFVGGLVGYFNTGVAVPNALPITKSIFTGSIAVDDSLNMAYIGGIAGGMLQRTNFVNGGNGHAVEFSGVRAENSNKLIDYKVSATAKPSSAGLIANIGGICGLCDELYTLQLSNVIGSINVSGNVAHDSLLVGGLIGKTYASGVSYVNIQKTFVNGDINVPDLPDQVKVGYLVGSANFNTKAYTIKSAYHNGANDAKVTKPFGSLLSSGMDASDDWMTNENFSYVVRNGEAENLDAVQFNGVKTLVQMQDDEFVDFLKEPFSTEKNPGWNKVIGRNNNLPYVEGENQGCAVGVLTVNFVDINNELVAEPQCVKNGDLVKMVDTTVVDSLDSLHCSGWEVLEKGVKVAFDETNPITKNTTIYAKYSLNTYNVVFKKSMGENGLVLDGPYAKDHGSSVDVPTNYTSKYDSVGYHFVGWHDTLAIKYVNRNLEIIAVYEPDMSIYTYLDKDGNFFDADTVLGNGARRDVPAPVETYKDSMYVYTFDAWYAVESDEFPGNVFQAKYIESLIDYYITFKTVGGTLIQKDTLHYGDAIAYPADPEMEGFKFTGWEPKLATVTGDTTIVAYFEAIPSKDPVEEPDTTKPVEPSVATVSDSAFLHTGSAFKLGYGIKGLDTNAVTTAKLVVSLNGEVIIDSVMADDVMESFKSDWELIDAAAGDYTIQVIVQNGEWVDSSYKQNYTVDSVYTVAAKNWQMVALSALDVDANGWSNGGVLYWWDETTPIGEYWQYRSFQGENADPTRGYWFGSSKGNTLTVRANASKKVEDVVWNLDNIYSGWNMVANPYGWAIDLSKADDNGAGVTYYKWLPAEGTYGPATEIGPYEAVWAKLTKGSSAKVTVPAAPCYASKEETSVGKKVAALRKTSSKSWSVVATLSDENGRTDFMNVIGAGDKEDSMDEPPAGMGDRVNLSVMDGKNALAKSVKAVANEYEWTFSVAASSAREGKLEFEGVEDLNALGLHLYVTVDGVTSEVKAGEAVGVALTKTSKDVGVRVASSAKVVAATNRISGFRMGQSSGMLQMQFDASSDLAGSTARYALVGVNGKRIASGSFTASAGSNVMNVSAPKTGIYYMHLKVGSQMSSAKVMVK